MPAGQSKSCAKLARGARAGLFALISIGCRPYQPSCDAADCKPESAGGGDAESVASSGNAGDSTTAPASEVGAGSGGSGAGSGGSGAGSGGAGGRAGANLAGGGTGGSVPVGPGPQCVRNADCDDGATCSGSERCVHGACVAGKPVVCGTNLTCVERGASNVCEFVKQGPWLSFYQGTPNNFGIGLFGISTPYAADVEPIELSQGIIDAEGEVLWDHMWSPDGRFLVLNVVGEQKALYWSEFDGGMPSTPQLIPDVPQDLNQIQLLPFAKDSNALLVRSDQLLIDIRFDAAGPHAAVVSDGLGSISNAAYCAGARVVLVDNALVSLDAPSSQPRLIADSVLSPDARRLLTTASGGFEWQECSMTGTPQPFALPLPNPDAERTLSWAPDSRHVLVHDEYDSKLDLTLIDVDAAKPKAAVLWHGSSPDAEHFDASFSPDSNYLLVADGSTWTLVTVATGLAAPLAMPSDASEVSWQGNANSLLIHRPLSDASSAAWWLAKPNSTATVIHSSNDPSLRLFVRVDDGFALAFAEEAGGTQISRVDLKHPEVARRKLLQKPLDGELTFIRFAPDGTGVAFERRLPDETQIYWLALTAAEEGRLVRLSKTDSLFGEFQPWRR